MKKILSILLATAMSFSLVACGSKGKEQAPEDKSGYQVNPELEVKDPGDRQKITLAAFILLPDIEQRIINFNDTNEDYYIEVNDYSQYNTQEDLSAGETKLNTEIQSGNIPDLIELSGLPLQSYINKGLLADLNEFLDKDSEFNKDSIVKGAYNALSSSNGLYQLSPSFTVTSLYGLKSKIGDIKSWNAKELQEFLLKNKDVEVPFINMPPLQVLHTLTMYSLDEFVNKEDGTTNFDSDEFVTLLNTVKDFSKDSDSEYKEADQELLTGKGLLATKYIARVEQFSTAYKNLDGDLNFIGFPTQSESGNFADFQFTFGITENSSNKDGAWEFIKSLFNEEAQKDVAEYETPVLKSAFDSSLAESEVSNEEKQLFADLINSLDKSSDYDGTLMVMIEEETKDFLEGNRSAEETAKAIQSRASIYISEGK